MKTGLFFGTFNPVHNGHLAIADYMACETDLNEVWLVVSPQNPLKKNEKLLDDFVRYNLVKLAVKNHSKLKACDIEFNLSKPSYTFKTLSFLKRKYPQKKFLLIIGEDNLRSFHLWKNYRKILNNYELYVYPRKILPNEKTKKELSHPNIKKFNLKLLNVSATEIRQMMKLKRNYKKMLPQKVYAVIKKNNFYQR